MTAPPIRLRRYRRDDLDRLSALLGDPAVMDPVGGPLPRGEIAGVLDRYLREDDPILVAACAVELADGTFVGSARLAQGEAGDLELGYLVATAHRGQGIGTSIARALIQLARAQHDATRVCARVAPSNAASIRVLEKAGMTRRATAHDGALLYAIDQPDAGDDEMSRSARSSASI